MDIFDHHLQNASSLQSCKKKEAPENTQTFASVDESSLRPLSSETMIAPNDKAKNSFPRKKSVRFPSSMTTVIEINTVTEDEKSLVWYQAQDYKEICKDIDATVFQLMQLGEDLRYWDTTKYSLRGIEQRFSPRYRDQRRKTQKATVGMVLRAQKEYGHIGPEAERRIQRLSRMCSKASRDRAIEVGTLDQEAAGIVQPIPHHLPSPRQIPSPTPTFHTSSSDHSMITSVIAQEA